MQPTPQSLFPNHHPCEILKPQTVYIVNVYSKWYMYFLHKTSKIFSPNSPPPNKNSFCYLGDNIVLVRTCGLAQWMLTVRMRIQALDSYWRDIREQAPLSPRQVKPHLYFISEFSLSMATCVSCSQPIFGGWQGLKDPLALQFTIRTRFSWELKAVL